MPALEAPAYEGGLTDVAGLRVGHFTHGQRPTGCTVILAEAGAACGVDVRGGAPGTRETDLLDPVNLVERVHAVVLSGGNIDMNMVSRIIERGLASAGRLCRFQVELEDHPGSLVRVLQVVSALGANILQVHHDRSFAPADVAKVSVTLLLETSDADHIARIREALSATQN